MGLEWIDSWWAILLFATIGGVSLYYWIKAAIADIGTKEETEMKKRVEDEFCKFYGAGATQIVLEVEIGRLRKREEFLEKKIEELEAQLEEGLAKNVELSHENAYFAKMVDESHTDARAAEIYERMREAKGYVLTEDERIMKLEAREEAKRNKRLW